MLTSRSRQRVTNSRVRSRMKPARQTSSMPCAASAPSIAASNAARDGWSRCGTTARAMPAAAAWSSPLASAWFETTSAISAGKSGAAQAAISA